MRYVWASVLLRVHGSQCEELDRSWLSCGLLTARHGVADVDQEGGLLNHEMVITASPGISAYSGRLGLQGAGHRMLLQLDRINVSQSGSSQLAAG